MDSTRRPDHDGAPTRPDTVGVGWPVAPRWHVDPRERAGRFLLTAGLVVWAPMSLLLAFIGGVAVGGWDSGDGRAVAGALDEPTFDKVLTGGMTVVTFAAAMAVFALARRRVSGRTRPASIAFGVVATCWAPAAAVTVLVAT